jgi:hypothetical protein
LVFISKEFTVLLLLNRFAQLLGLLLKDTRPLAHTRHTRPDLFLSPAKYGIKRLLLQLDELLLQVLLWLIHDVSSVTQDLDLGCKG